jgi:Fe-Mn family superoxide dismutase
MDNLNKYPFSLMSLPYDKDAFDPNFLSKESFDYHYDKHHLGYVNNLNLLIKDLKQNFHDKSLEEIINFLSGNLDKPNFLKIYNNAGQVWNHNFYWMSLTPKKLDRTQYKIFQLIRDQFDSWENFVKQFVDASLSHFASGWSWLIFNQKENNLQIITTKNATTGFENSGYVPLFTCDLWEHAYYITFRNNRASYVKQMLEEYLNWEFLDKNFVSVM